MTGVELELADCDTPARVQIRFDAFNALNHHTLGNPTTGITSSDFGRITGISDTRTAQVGAKFNF